MCDRLSSSMSLRCTLTFASTSSGVCRSPTRAVSSPFFAAATAAAVAGQSTSAACHSEPWGGDVRDQKRMSSPHLSCLFLEYQPRQLAAHSVGAAGDVDQIAAIDRLADQVPLLWNERR